MEWLKELLGEELYNQVTGKLGADVKLLKDDGSHVAKTALDEMTALRDAAVGQVNEMSNKVGELSKATKDNEELRKSLDDIKASNETLAKQNADISLKSAVKLAAIGAKVKDPADVLALVDMSKLKLDGDKVLGLEEALNGLRGAKPYLFDVASTQTGGGANPAGVGGTGGAATEEQTISAAFSKGLGS